MTTQLKFNAFDEYGREEKVKALFNTLKESHTYVDFIPWNPKNPTHHAWHGSHEDLTPENQTKMKFLLEYIEKYTYPYDVPISNFWFKRYSPGEFSGLHTDINQMNEGTNHKWYTTVTLVESNESGGENIIAGADDIRDELKIFSLKKLGDALTWDNVTTHGIARVIKGRRTVLVTLKPGHNKTRYWGPIR